MLVRDVGPGVRRSCPPSTMGKAGGPAGDLRAYAARRGFEVVRVRRFGLGPDERPAGVPAHSPIMPPLGRWGLSFPSRSRPAWRMLSPDVFTLGSNTARHFALDRQHAARHAPGGLAPAGRVPRVATILRKSFPISTITGIVGAIMNHDGQGGRSMLDAISWTFTAGSSSGAGINLEVPS
jgi:hypothetical protein